MKLEPTEDRIIVEPIEEKPKETASGLVIVQTGRKDPPSRGRIVSVGPGRRTDQGVTLTPTVKPGDEVLFGKFAGTQLEVEGKPVLLIRDADILAVMR